MKSRDPSCSLLIFMERSSGLLLWILIQFIILNSVATEKFKLSIIDNDGRIVRNESGNIEITLEVNLNYTLRCEADEPIRMQKDGRYLKFQKNNENGKRYFAEIYLPKVNVGYVGYYECKTKRETPNYTYIYVFVNDTQRPLVKSEKNEDIISDEKKDVNIPCKPTMPDNLVELITLDNNQVLFSSNKTKKLSGHPNFVYKEVEYDPKNGFKITRAMDFTNLICRGESQNGVSDTNPMGIYITKTSTVKIHSNSHGYAFEGETFILTCSARIYGNIKTELTWKTPLGVNTHVRWNLTDTKLFEFKHALTVKNVQKSDEGNYTCSAGRQKITDTYEMKILKTGEPLLYVSEPNNDYEVVKNIFENVTLTVNYRSYPTNLSLHWFAPGNLTPTPIQRSKKYEIKEKESSIILQIQNVSLHDSSHYDLKADNGLEKKTLRFTVKIKSKPEVSFEKSNVYIQTGRETRISCKTMAYPKANVIWTFIPCKTTPKWPSCNYSAAVNYSSSRFSEVSMIETIHYFNIKPYSPGKIECRAENTLGANSKDDYILIGDLTDNLTVYGVDENHQIAKGDEVIITCGALAYYYSANLDWYKDEQLITNGSGIEVVTVDSDYSYKKTIKFKSIENEHDGIYECRATVIESELETRSKFLTITVNEPAKPIIDQTNLGEEHELRLTEPLELLCKSKAVPKPTITWYKDEEPITDGNNISISDDNTILRIKHMIPENEGKYKCVSSNRVGTTDKTSLVTISNMPGLKTGGIVGIVSFIALLIVLIIYMGIRILKEREQRKAAIAHFIKGCPEKINPAISLNEQALYLPYDPKFEFPIEKLKIDENSTLGSGNFGIVYKASAQGIEPDKNETIVAVKMVKGTAELANIKALESELKIMGHLPRHPNVIRLLGAVTVKRDELKIIVEYCLNGNIQDTLRKNQDSFVNQINPDTQKIDTTILQKPLSSDNDTSIGSSYKVLETKMTIKTSDLIIWAFQVAQGMDFLSSHNVLHNDLAARNILLSENNVVKISDFGLARSICDKNYYKKEGNEGLPVKWLALESLSDTKKIFSTSTDVWSFGIMLWEFFSLAKKPYANLDNLTLDKFRLKLATGYRLDKPTYANQEIYGIMLECWHSDPKQRPNFNDLKDKLSKLGVGVSNYWIDKPPAKTDESICQEEQNCGRTKLWNSILSAKRKINENKELEVPVNISLNFNCSDVLPPDVVYLNDIIVQPSQKSSRESETPQENSVTMRKYINETEIDLSKSTNTNVVLAFSNDSYDME